MGSADSYTGEFPLRCRALILAQQTGRQGQIPTQVACRQQQAYLPH